MELFPTNIYPFCIIQTQIKRAEGESRRRYPFNASEYKLGLDVSWKQSYCEKAVNEKNLFLLTYGAEQKPAGRLRCVSPENFGGFMKKKELQSIDYIKERADENLAKTKSVFLYRRELAIRLALRQKEFTQKKLAKRLKMTESYVSKLITGERYSKEFEFFVRYNLGVDYFGI